MQTAAVGNSVAASPQGTDRGMAAMDSEDFFKILVTELRQQDPLEPTDTGTMIEQVSQIRGIELSSQLTDALTQLTSQQQTAGLSDLLGKYVTAVVAAADGTEQEVAGVVTGVHFDSDNSAVLELDTGQAVPAGSVVRITSAEMAELGLQDSEAQPASASSTATDGNTATDKAAQSAKQRDGGLLTWLDSLLGL